MVDQVEIGEPGVMLEIPKMPQLWTAENIIVSVHDVLGALACWGVRQSPYTAPENLKEAVEQFAANWPHEDYKMMDSETLWISIKETIKRCPLVTAWNNSKKGDVQISFHSRYDQPHPDYDFIDLDALANNMAHQIVLDHQVNKAQEAIHQTERNHNG